MKLLKFQLLGAINCLLAILPAVLLSGFFFEYPLIPIDSLLHQYLPDSVLLFSIGINIYLAYKLLWKKYDSAKFKQYLILTCLTIFWFIWLFVGYFMASEIVYLISSRILIIGIFFYLKKTSIKWAFVTSFVTFLVMTLAVVFAFEEDYCWKKGDEMVIGQPKMITILGEEARKVMPGGNDISISEDGTTIIGTAAYYHFKCHKTFDLNKALKEKYLFVK